MVNHKLNFNDFEEVDYYLIAIHTFLADYRLAYFINKNLVILLSNNKTGVQINIDNVAFTFSRFDYDDKKNDLFWSLIQNQSQLIYREETKDETQNNFDLFSSSLQTVTQSEFLLPNFKKANYFLKIENIDANFDLEKTISRLNTIDKISIAYSIDVINNKHNLIF